MQAGFSRRFWPFLVAALVAGIDLVAKAWAERSLSTNASQGGLVQLQLSYNTGVAFSLGGDAPLVVVIGVTAALTMSIAVFAWRVALRATTPQLAAGGFVLGGATANLIDRAGDGQVTDYLHTGWWPTFNLADVAIVTGAVALVLVTSRNDDEVAEGKASSNATTNPESQ